MAVDYCCSAGGSTGDRQWDVQFVDRFHRSESASGRRLLHYVVGRVVVERISDDMASAYVCRPRHAGAVAGGR